MDQLLDRKNSSSWQDSSFFVRRWWVRLGLTIGLVTTPILMALIFFLVLTPLGILRKLLRSSEFNTKFVPAAKTYWIERKEPQVTKESMERLF